MKHIILSLIAACVAIGAHAGKIADSFDAIKALPDIMLIEMPPADLQKNGIDRAFVGLFPAAGDDVAARIAEITRALPAELVAIDKNLGVAAAKAYVEKATDSKSEALMVLSKKGQIVTMFVVGNHDKVMTMLNKQ